MERTYIRIGNENYEKMNGSFGLTTLKDKHVKIKGNTIQFSFKGKKVIHHDIYSTIKSWHNQSKNAGIFPDGNCFNTTIQTVRAKVLTVEWSIIILKMLQAVHLLPKIFGPGLDP